MIARPRELGLVALVALGAVACQTQRVSPSEIPGQPIAFIYLSEEDARRKAEVLSEPAATRTDPTTNRGVVDLNDLRDFLEQSFGERGGAAEGAGRLALLDARTGEVSMVAAARRGATPLAWSRDRSKLLFSQRDADLLQLFEWAPESRLVTRVSRGPDRHPQGCYGPDGRYVVVVSRIEPVDGDPYTRRSTFRLALSAPGGPDQGIEVISPGPMDGDPTCSPDGSSVAYVRFASRKRSAIWIHPFDRPESAHVLTPGSEPAFSPDGEWIVYSQRVGDTRRLWRIRSDGTGRTRLGRVGGELQESGPSVAPDGSMVVYESVRSHRYRLFLRRFDGSGDSVLLSTGDGMHAVW